MEINVKNLREEFDGLHHAIETSDGINLFLRAWMPNKKSNIAILILHGITAYSGSYDLIGTQLSNVGYAVYGLDLRGHGLSDGNRGDYSSKERLILDLGETVNFIKKKHELLILLGHSLGVITAVIASNNYLENIDGLILLSAARVVRPGIYPEMPFTKKLKILFSSIIKPSKPVISYHRDGMLGLDDPLYNFNYTLRFMKIYKVDDVVFPLNLNIPILLGIGEHDELFTIESARSFFDEIPAKNKKFIILPGAKHAVFPDGSWAEIFDWLISNFKIK